LEQNSNRKAASIAMKLKAFYPVFVGIRKIYFRAKQS
jgi:hypothetical protein